METNKKPHGNKGKVFSQEHRDKIRQNNLDNPRRYWLGKKMPESMKKKMSEKRLGIKLSEETRKKMSESKKGISTKSWAKTGKDSHRWIEDRTLIKRQDRHDNPLYKEWRMSVWKRDNFKCRLADDKCKGRLEAHHILNYKDYPELRYQTNNGIALCRHHHPLGREEEKRLEPLFMELVSVSREHFGNTEKF